MGAVQGDRDGKPTDVTVAGPISFSGLGLGTGRKLTTAAAARKHKKPKLLGRLNSGSCAVERSKLGAQAASRHLIGMLRRKT